MEKVTKVLHIIPDIDGGGVGSVVYNYISHMNLDGIMIDIVTQDFGREQFLAKKFAAARAGVNYIIRRKHDIKKHFKAIESILLNGHYDVVHSHDQNWSVFYLLLAKKYGVKKRIAHSHLTAQYHDSAKIMVLNLFNPLLKKMATGYFACGRDAGVYMWGEKIAASTSLYIMNNGIDINRYRYDENTRILYRQKYGLVGKTVLGHVGRFSKQKNHEFLLDIFEEFHKKNVDSILLLVGQGELEEDIKKRVEEKKISSAVIVMGQRDDVHSLMNAIDLFLLPSLYEGLPVVGIEAQANGLPCLFADTITEEAVLLPTTERMSLGNSVVEWAEQMERMLAKRMREDRVLAYQSVRNKGYDIAVEAEKLKSYYLD